MTVIDTAIRTIGVWLALGVVLVGGACAISLGYEAVMRSRARKARRDVLSWSAVSCFYCGHRGSAHQLIERTASNVLTLGKCERDGCLCTGFSPDYIGRTEHNG